MSSSEDLVGNFLLRVNVMSEEQTKVLIRVKPDNVGTQEYQDMLKEFQAEDEKFEGVISVPKNNFLVTDEGDLLIVHPHRIDYAVAYEPHEFQILTEQ